MYIIIIVYEYVICIFEEELIFLYMEVVIIFGRLMFVCVFCDIDYIIIIV